MKKRLFGILLSLALVLGMMPALGMSTPAYAAAEDTVYELTNEFLPGNNYIIAASNTGDAPVLLNDGAQVATTKVKVENGKICNPKLTTVFSAIGEGTEVNNLRNGKKYLIGRTVIFAGRPEVQLAPIDEPSTDGSWIYNEGILKYRGGDKDYYMNYDGRTLYVTTSSEEATTVYLFKEVKYDLWVGGVQVTSSNKGNVLAGDPENDGKVSFIPAAGETPATLTLNGANIKTGYNIDPLNVGIYYTGSEELNIELAGENAVGIGASFSEGIYSHNSGAITISGEGSLAAKGRDAAIKSYDGPVTISSGTVTFEDSLEGIGAKDVMISGGDVTASGVRGIQADSVTVSGGTVIAMGGEFGIYARNSVTISGGTVSASGYEGPAISGTVKNSIVGTGWTNTDGTAGETVITESEAGQNISSFKKVEFPKGTAYPLWIGGTQVTSTTRSGRNWFYNVKTNTLRLNGAIEGSGEYTDGYANYDYGIRCAMDKLTINVPTDSTVEGSGTKTYSCGILAPSCDLTITGSGKLTAKGGSGDTGDGSYGYTSGLYANTINVTGKLEAIGGHSSKGEHESRGIDASEINVSGELTASGEGYGINVKKTNDVIVIKEGSKVTITGGKSCVYNGVVKTAINGTAWEDVGGTEGETLIKAGNTEHDLSKFKKAVFPTEADPATVTAKPTGKTLTYNGKAQELVTAGKAEGGEMQYAIGKDNKTAPTTGWSTSIPTATDARTYCVWYKVVGDANHSDSDPLCIKVTISEKDPDPVKESTITFDLNGGTLNGQTGTVTVKAANGTIITLPAPTRDGYTFDYWKGSKHHAGDKYTVNGDHTFKAVWKTGAGGDGSKGGSSKKGVNTGDENTLGAWIVLLMAALAGTTGMVFARKRK